MIGSGVILGPICYNGENENLEMWGRMEKILKSWSGMRRYLEKEMLAYSLQGRVRYNCTRYVGMDDCHIFEIFIDGKLIKQFSWETVNSYFLSHHYYDDWKKSKPLNLAEYWKGFWHLLKVTPINKRTEYMDEEFCAALEIYRNQDIAQSLYATNPLVRMFAILDRRIGKRTLRKVKSSISEQPEWLQYFYGLRLEAEGINVE